MHVCKPSIYVLSDLYSKSQFQFNIYNKHTSFYVLWQERGLKEDEYKPKTAFVFYEVVISIVPDKRAEILILPISC